MNLWVFGDKFPQENISGGSAIDMEVKNILTDVYTNALDNVKIWESQGKNN